MDISKKKKVHKLVRKVTQCLIERVVARPLMGDRKGALSEEKLNKIATGNWIDVRATDWVSNSGKGAPKYASKYRNVSLIDHSLSVAVGAMAMSAYSQVSLGVEVDKKLEQELFVIGLVGLLHDVNKLLPSDLPLSSAEVAECLSQLYERWQLGEVLEGLGIELDTNALFQLINYVEAGTAMAGTESGLVDRQLRHRVQIYVRMCDQLDSAFHLLGNEGGFDGVLKALVSWSHALPDWLVQWRHISVYDPAHPYLLDKLQLHLSQQCTLQCGISPLLEMHHDGQLDMLLPELEADTIIEVALPKFIQSLKTGFDISISTTKKPDIMGGTPDWALLQEYLEADGRKQAELLAIGRQDFGYFSEFVTAQGFGLRFASKLPKNAKTLTPLATNEEFSLLGSYSALVSLILVHGAQSSRIKLPDLNERLARIKDALAPYGLALSPPESLSHPLSLRTWYAMQITDFAASNPEVFDALFSDRGVVVQLYTGRLNDEGNQVDGIFQALKGDEYEPRLVAVLERFKKLLKGQPILDGLNGRRDGTQGCLITGEPGQGRIEAKDELYAIKASQFSTRRGRPAQLGDSKGRTYLSPTSFMEYKLRARRHGKSKAEFPVLLYSPTTNGLFAELRLSDELEADFGLFDLNREDAKKTVLYGHEIFQRRLSLARQESMPTTFAEQLDWLELLTKAVRRTGRPFHVFRGLATSRPEILYIDCMPPTLRKLALGKNGLRLEELGTLYESIRIAKAILAARGGVKLLDGILSLNQRYGALCQAKMLLEEQITQLHQQNKVQGLGLFKEASVAISNQLEELRSTMTMTKQDSIIISLAHKAAGLQRAFGTGASRSEQQLIFKLIITAVREHIRSPLESDDELKRLITGKLQRKLAGTKYLGNSIHRNGLSVFDACWEIAEFFVDQLWHPLLNSRLPSRSLQSQLLEIYRVEMLLTYKSRKQNTSTLNEV